MTLDEALAALLRDHSSPVKAQIPPDEELFHPDFVGLEMFSRKEYEMTVPKFLTEHVYVLVRDRVMAAGRVEPHETWLTVQRPLEYGNVLFYRDGMTALDLPAHLQKLATRVPTVGGRARMCQNIVRQWARRKSDITDYVAELSGVLHPGKEAMMSIHIYRKPDENHITTTPYVQMQR